MSGQSNENFKLFANDSSGKYREINKISLSYETKMRKSNLITVLYAVITVSYGKENFKVFTKICLFCYFQHGEKREKSVAGHESDKLIESYSALPTTEQQFESYSIIRRFKSLTQVNSGQYKWALLFLLPFPSMTSSASTIHSNKSNKSGFLPTGPDCSVSVFHSCNYFPNSCSGS